MTQKIPIPEMPITLSVKKLTAVRTAINRLKTENAALKAENERLREALMSIRTQLSLAYHNISEGWIWRGGRSNLAYMAQLADAALTEDEK